jgi:uncharacterized protein involved in propanediol utilization
MTTCLKVEGDLYIQSNLPEGGGRSLYTVKPALRWRGISIYHQTCLKVEGDLYIQSNLPEGASSTVRQV